MDTLGIISAIPTLNMTHWLVDMPDSSPAMLFLSPYSACYWLKSWRITRIRHLFNPSLSSLVLAATACKPTAHTHCSLPFSEKSARASSDMTSHSIDMYPCEFHRFKPCCCNKPGKLLAGMHPQWATVPKRRLLSPLELTFVSVSCAVLSATGLHRASNVWVEWALLPSLLQHSGLGFHQ